VLNTKPISLFKDKAMVKKSSDCCTETSAPQPVSEDIKQGIKAQQTSKVEADSS
jgi:hypothetical protein